MQLTNLISGLIGALLTAALSGLIRLWLDARAQDLAERRLAYVYLTRVVEVLAAAEVIRKIIPLFVPENVKNEWESNNKDFKPSHKICTQISLKLIGAQKAKLNDTSDLRVIPRWVKALMESSKDIKLTPEQLSRLPRDVTYASNQFQKAYLNYIQVVELWAAFVENDECYWVTPEGIHDQWVCLVNFVQYSRKLSNALIKAGAASLREASELQDNLMSDLLAKILSKWSDKQQLAAALASDVSSG
jgi:hypothetical protein